MKTASRKYYKSSSFKMASLFTILLGLAALLLGYFLYDFGSQNFTRESEALIDREMEYILSITEDKSKQDVTRYIGELSGKYEHPVYLYYTDSGQILAGNILQLPEKTTLIKEGLLSFQTRLNGRERMVAFKIHTFADNTRLLIGRDIHLITQSYEKLKWITGFIIFFMLIVIAVSFFISFFVVGRINTIALTAQQIMDTGDLSQRISIDTNWDDLSNLGQTLNDLLERVENLMQGIRDVSDNIAHDLRTPLTRLRNDLENAQNKTPSREDVDRLLTEADQLLATFNSLLRISNIEKAKRRHTFSPISLKEILNDVVELYDTLAEEKQIALTTSLDKDLHINGDRDLLFQLFANLLDNAIKFSSENGKVSISLSQQSGTPVVTIIDRGPGISEADKEKLFDRFYRADASRNTPGNGLGLSLVKAVADYHKASILLADNDPGLRVDVVFKANSHRAYLAQN